MIEKIKHIGNPLTIVAIFAALAEISGTVIPTVLDDKYHIYIVLFLIFFPVLLVSLFFFTLWCKPWTLYGPSDFQNEELFLQMITELQKLSLKLKGIKIQFQHSNKKIVNEVLSSDNLQKEVTNRIHEAYNNEITQISDRLDDIRSDIDHCTIRILSRSFPQSKLQNDIFHELQKSTEALTLSQICENVKRDKMETKKALERMVKRQIIKTIKNPGD